MGKVSLFRTYFPTVLVVLSMLAMTYVLFSPAMKGLVMLPLDLLVTHYSPWAQPGTILVKNPYMQDSIAQMYPWKLYFFHSIRQGSVPLWNPYQHFGMPFMASGKPMVFYPFSWLGLLGDVPGWNLLLWSQLFLSMLFMYACAREFKLSRVAALLSSISFGWSSLMIGVLEFGSEGHAILWFPLLLLFVKKYLDTSNVVYCGWFAVNLSLSMLAGQLQYTAYFLLFLAVFALWNGKQRMISRKQYVLLFISCLAGGGIAAVQLGPEFIMYSQSARHVLGSPDIFTRGLVPLYKLSRLFAPDVFGHPSTGDLTVGYIETGGYFGILTLFMAWVAVRYGWQEHRIKFFALVFLCSVLLSLKGIGEIVLFLRIPGITGGSGDRIFVLVLFSGVILGAYGMDFLRKKIRWNNLIRISLEFTGILLCISMYLYRNQPYLESAGRQTILYGLRFPVLICVGTVLCMIFLGYVQYVRNIRVYLLTGFILLVQFVDLYRMAYRFVTFSNPKFLYPDTPLIRVLKEKTASGLERVHGLTGPEIATALGIYTVDVYNPLYSLQTAEYLGAVSGQMYDSFPIDNKQYLTRGDGFVKKVMDVSGIKYIVVDRGVNPSEMLLGTEYFSTQFRPFYEDDQHSVFENTTVYPRFGVYYKTVFAKSDSDALDLISSNSVDMRDTLIVMEQIPILNSEATGSATVVSYTPDGVVFAVTSDAPGVFAISDTYASGWTAAINGKQSKILRVNYNFRGVLIPAGSSEIEFSYLPPYVSLWKAISGLSMLFTCLVLFKEFLSCTGKRPQVYSP